MLENSSHDINRPGPRIKSVAAALIFCVLLGPVGLLYASWWGGVIMILIGIIVISSQLSFPIILVWLISCVWGVRAVEVQHRQYLNNAKKGPLYDAKKDHPA